jgi:hypothetical protein
MANLLFVPSIQLLNAIHSNLSIQTLTFDLAIPLSQQLAKSAKDFEEGSKAIVTQYFGLNVAIGNFHFAFQSHFAQAPPFD